jgi:hypothetical protein
VQLLVQVAAVNLALVLLLVPARRGRWEVAALGAAVLIALQMAAAHWFYLYIVWWLPFVLVALMARVGEVRADSESEALGRMDESLM